MDSQVAAWPDDEGPAAVLDCREQCGQPEGEAAAPAWPGAMLSKDPAHRPWTSGMKGCTELRAMAGLPMAVPAPRAISVNVAFGRADPASQAVAGGPSRRPASRIVGGVAVLNKRPAAELLDHSRDLRHATQPARQHTGEPDTQHICRMAGLHFPGSQAVSRRCRSPPWVAPMGCPRGLPRGLPRPVHECAHRTFGWSSTGKLKPACASTPLSQSATPLYAIGHDARWHLNLRLREPIAGRPGTVVRGVKA